MADGCDREVDDRKEYAERMKFEHELINRRVTWLLTSQTILFTGYGLVLKAQEENHTVPVDFLQVLVFAGSATALLIWIGIVASFLAKEHIWLDFRSSHANEPFWVRTWITYAGFTPEFCLPLILVGAWLYLSKRLPSFPTRTLATTVIALGSVALTSIVAVVLHRKHVWRARSRSQAKQTKG